MITTLLEGNKVFVSEQFEKEKEYYNALVKDQRPTVLWIGCSENVRLQLEHLQEYPFVRSAMNAKKLNLHGWVYDMSSGEIRIIKTERPHRI